MIAVYENVPLKLLNTMGIGGVARRLVSWEAPDDLRDFFSLPRYREAVVSVKPVGQGSNLLFVNDRYDGTLLSCNNETVQEFLHGDKIILKVGAGKVLDELARETASRGFWGLENLALIPGTIGAAAVQNVGAYGVEFGSLVKDVYCYDRHSGGMVTVGCQEIKYGYRDSIFKHSPYKERYIIVSVDIELSRLPMPVLDYGNLAAKVGEAPEAIDVYRTVSSVRREKLPAVNEVGSAGSFFKNPVLNEEEYERFMTRVTEMGLNPEEVPVYKVALPDGSLGYKLSAAWLIDHTGWKGIIRDNVGTWLRQPLVIVNLTGRASGGEVSRLASDISLDINGRLGVMLTPEVEYIM